MRPRIRRFILVAFLVPVTAGLAAPAAAQDADTTRLVDRIDVRHAEHALVSRLGDVALLIDGPDLYIQLTDRGLDDIETPDEDELADEGLGARLLGAMLRAGVRELLDHAIAYPITDLGRAEYVDRRLVLEDHEGDAIMDITLNDRDILTDFREREARAFARELRRRMAADN